MKDILTVAIALVAALVGLRAAYLWLLASRVPIVPFWADEPNAIAPVDPHAYQISWTVAIMDAYNKGSALNARAARWTAVATLLAMLTTVVGAIPL